ncbi:cytochrome P450 94A1-like protein [Carex littledalei]|uniref:Cytochrome P450 94A1-like protein n=1 Tax=Carex littledalei TaxID=544730 RepID=A0A833QYT7_9POAL|nr:cytochrome P450 94A1-like protein [Carex littledalei]
MPGDDHGVLTANISNVEHVLRTNFQNYPKGERFLTTLHDFLGTGIFNADGKTWRDQRKTARFEFNTRSLRSFVVQCVKQEIQTRLLPFLERISANGQAVDLQNLFERFAFDNVCKVSFGLDPGYLDPELAGGSAQDKNGCESTTSFAEAFRDATHLSAGRFWYAIQRLWKIKKIFDIGSERRLRESISTVHEFADQIIRSRKEEKQKDENHDLLSRFVASSDNYSEKFLRDIVISFLLAGRETTSSALSWFFWILSSRPDVEAKILDETRSVRAKNGGSETGRYDFEELKEMHYLHAALSESMRLYPPVPANQAQAMKDDVLPDGTRIKKGWFISYNAYAMGRMEANWGKDCMEYRPERWIDADGTFRQESPLKFTAFHAGPRMCLGKEMAYIQMKSIVGSILERFVMEIDDKGRCPEKVMSLTLRMKDGLPFRVKKRNY